ncbi:MAG: hypothetical protein AB8G22_01745 [Saprospiraceae bacterium]
MTDQSKFTTYSRIWHIRDNSLFLLILIGSMLSCSIDDVRNIDGFSANPAVAVPVATVNFELAEALQDQTNINISDDNGIGIVFREESLLDLSFADLADQVTEEVAVSIYQTAEVGTIEIDDFTKNRSLTLSEVADKFSEPLRSGVLNNDGNTTSIPAFTEEVQLETALEEIEEFASIDIQSGMLSISVENNFPFDLQNLLLRIVNLDSGVAISTFSFPIIAAGSTQSSTASLNNKMLTNNLGVVIPTIQSPGTPGTSSATIDLSSALVVDLAMQDIVVRGGEANLPDGRALESKNIEMNFTSENDVEFTEITFNDAVEMQYFIKSELATDLEMTLAFPDSKGIDGEIIQKTILIPFTGLNDSIAGSISFANASFLLNQDANQPFNKLKATYQLNIVSPGDELVSFDASDQLTINLGFSDFDVSAVQGYFGQIETVIDEGMVELDFDFSIFEETSSPIFFTNPQILLNYDNTFGIPFGIDLDLNSIGAFGNNQELMLNDDLVFVANIIDADNSIDRQNSNVVDFLSNYPTQFNYSGKAVTNPNGRPNTSNFISTDSRISLGIEADLPFNFKAENIVFRDTVAAELPQEDLEEVAEIELHANYTNGFPLGCTLTLKALNNQTETLIAEGIQLESATADETGKTTEAKAGKIVEMFTGAQMDALLNAEELIIELQLQTPDDGQSPATLYTDYDVTLGLGLILHFNLGN